MLNRLSSVTPSTATGCLDDVNLALVMAALASFNVSGTEDEENVPKVRDKDFIADIGRKGGGGRPRACSRCCRSPGPCPWPG